MNDIKTLDHHIVIRETVGYDLLKQVDLMDIPAVMQFLKIVHNYNRLCRLNDGELG